MTYPLQSDKDGAKIFTSEWGNKYEILIVKTSYFPQFRWDNNVVTVIVKAYLIGAKDVRIMNTVLDFLIRIIQDDPTTILYWICHSEDGRHLNRHRYFNMLF